jgi:hypothetical protein
MIVERHSRLAPTDDEDVEGVVGQSILNGIPVQLKSTISAIAGK